MHEGVTNPFGRPTHTKIRTWQGLWSCSLVLWGFHARVATRDWRGSQGRVKGGAPGGVLSGGFRSVGRRLFGSVAAFICHYIKRRVTRHLPCTLGAGRFSSSSSSSVVVLPHQPAAKNCCLHYGGGNAGTLAAGRGLRSSPILKFE